MAPDSTLLVELEDRNPDGRGRGYSQGRAVLVSQGLPGERVRVRVDRETRGTVQGRVAELVDPINSRIDTACPHTFVCTGCPMLGEDPDEELVFKEKMIRTTLASAKSDLESLCRGVERPSEIFEYRYYAKQVFSHHKNEMTLGSYVAGTHEVVSNRDCPVLAPRLSEVMRVTEEVVAAEKVWIATQRDSGLKHAVARLSAATGEVLMTWVVSGVLSSVQRAAIERAALSLRTRCEHVAGVALVINETQGNVILRGGVEVIDGASHIVESMSGYEHRVGPLSFFQINPVAAAALFDRALDAAGQGGTCLELFSGVGVLTLPLSDRFKRVVAVEVVEEASKSLAGRLMELGKTSVEARWGDATAVAKQILEAEAVEVVVADPPRRGLGEELCSLIGQSRVKRVVLLSCEPKTLARDIPHLVAGGLVVRAVWGIDQFPRTAHVETVTLLERPSLGL